MSEVSKITIIIATSFSQHNHPTSAASFDLVCQYERQRFISSASFNFLSISVVLLSNKTCEECFGLKLCASFPVERSEKASEKWVLK